MTGLLIVSSCQKKKEVFFLCVPRRQIRVFCSREEVKLRICSCLACVYRIMDARGKFGER